MSRRVLLVRHPPVAEWLRGVCYGSSDVPLADDAPARIREIVAGVTARGPITHLYHSGLARCAAVADSVAARSGVIPVVDVRLRERCFGDWELRRWDDVHSATGDAMMGMVTAPATWSPPGGETTHELRDRVLAWYADLPAGGTTVALTHGGPIAVLLGTLLGTPACDWQALIPPPGSIVALE
ncbi:Phosphoglycerate mutase OS=Isosphaera pallida (strain ATCC 43644 / DSM 9630 / IS1B) GN=Isop_2401 PE=4 SV=1: His_Phos_1 [Gemmataceae bacterium]|nr:Phosphoglycerate mutase OS=Isosphaera pallida (strain ATCC 43644 / DSM 9630 / IS1B) GN=Isop_2401 PE=4 SV=1: His_Phos_1 [Gemmataceae bacterium]VTU02493.1 Phosphoglycerate mutase OS=Isosphaera pallida (strain ATCC 43644 / DSM 9630 / IS1B) GN=Isop_2401 PE=4 SV=1: His_Phos_1 [Gemmataceae bacterium]